MACFLTQLLGQAQAPRDSVEAWRPVARDKKVSPALGAYMASAV